MSVVAVAADVVAEVEVPLRYDLPATTGAFQLGRRDPAVRVIGATSTWRAVRTPDGPGTAHYQHVAEGLVRVAAWGPGAGWLAAQAPMALGADDDVAGFDDLVARHPVLGPLHRRRPGWRIGGSGAVLDAVVLSILAQKVTGLEAKRAWHGLLRRWGEAAPGPPGLRLPPTAATLAGLAYHDLHRLGVERKRAETVLVAARATLAGRLPSVVTGPWAGAEAALRAVPGIGVWTAAEVRRIALGDADAVSFGDYHLPHIVAFNLLGRRRGSDEQMAELLEPFRPHRGRVVRLLELVGTSPPRRGPRLAPNGLERR
jgi:3-methyladenine DNA glycosylase/8-oxoguanine DNA glycosylase